MVSVGLVFTAIMFILYGCGCLDFPSQVVCILLGTTTANVLGLGFILLRGLFPNNNK